MKRRGKRRGRKWRGGIAQELGHGRCKTINKNTSRNRRRTRSRKRRRRKSKRKYRFRVKRRCKWRQMKCLPQHKAGGGTRQARQKGPETKEQQHAFWNASCTPRCLPPCLPLPTPATPRTHKQLAFALATGRTEQQARYTNTRKCYTTSKLKKSRFK